MESEVSTEQLASELGQCEEQLINAKGGSFKLWFIGRLFHSYLKGSICLAWMTGLVYVIVSGLLLGLTGRHDRSIIDPPHFPISFALMAGSMSVDTLLLLRSLSSGKGLAGDGRDHVFRSWFAVSIFSSIGFWLVAYAFAIPQAIGFYVIVLGAVPAYFVVTRMMIILERISAIRRKTDLLRSKLERVKRFEQEQEAKRKRFEEEQMAKGLTSFESFYAGKLWGSQTQVDEWKAIEESITSGFRQIPTRVFQSWIAKLLRKKGYEKVESFGSFMFATKGTETVLVKTVRYSEGSLAGNKEVRNAIADIYVHKASRAILIVTSEFTEEAYMQAERSPIELWNLGKLRHEFVEHFLKAQGPYSPTDQVNNERFNLE